VEVALPWSVPGLPPAVSAIAYAGNPGV